MNNSGGKRQLFRLSLHVVVTNLVCTNKQAIAIKKVTIQLSNAEWEELVRLKVSLRLKNIKIQF